MRRIAGLCQIATVNQAAIEMALNADFSDLEDAIQYSTAVVNQLEAIVTRNPKDFPVVTPLTAIRRIPPNPPCVPRQSQGTRLCLTHIFLYNLKSLHCLDLRRELQKS